MQESLGRRCALPPPCTQETHLPFRIILDVQLASLGRSTEFWKVAGNGSGAGRGKDLDEFCAFACLSQSSPVRNKNQQPVAAPVLPLT